MASLIFLCHIRCFAASRLPLPYPPLFSLLVVTGKIRLSRARNTSAASTGTSRFPAGLSRVPWLHPHAGFHGGEFLPLGFRRHAGHSHPLTGRRATAPLAACTSGLLAT